MVRLVIICILFAILISTTSCGQLWGYHDLGNNFYLDEGDGPNEKSIEYCTAASGTNPCMAGILIVPNYTRQVDKNGNIAEYIQNAKSNEDWIIAKSLQIKDKKENYWIIDKSLNLSNDYYDNTNLDSIIQSHVKGPFDLSSFQNKIKELNINLAID